MNTQLTLIPEIYSSFETPYFDGGQVLSFEQTYAIGALYDDRFKALEFFGIDNDPEVAEEGEVLIFRFGDCEDTHIQPEFINILKECRLSYLSTLAIMHVDFTLEDGQRMVQEAYDMDLVDADVTKEEDPELIRLQEGWEALGID